MRDIRIISAPSILGLKPSGVEQLADSLLSSGLVGRLQSTNPVLHVPTLNDLYNHKRDPETNCLNPATTKDFSLELIKVISGTIDKQQFSFVLGGDCSILLGIMPALKIKGNYGLIFLDAHADFYEPEKSTTGELADMDLAIVTGRGPDILTNIYDLKPYVKDENVIHVGQRDWEQSKQYGSQDIKNTAIKCIDLNSIENSGIEATSVRISNYIEQLNLEGFWIHYDTDVLSDEINPAVDYRLPGGLQFDEVEYLLKDLLSTSLIIGISVTILNPMLDKDGYVSKSITESLERVFNA